VVHNRQSTDSAGIGLVPLVLIAVAAALIAGVVAYLIRASQPAPPAALTAEAKAYVRNLGLGEVDMKAKENFMNSTLVEVTGKLTNKGDRELRLVEINCVFYDPYGQVVLRERVPILRSTTRPLGSGESRSFRLAFDNIPPGWNQALPQLVIANIDFE
jgi:hypothetical protein